jgi:hypothetical protein
LPPRRGRPLLGGCPCGSVCWFLLLFACTSGQLANPPGPPEGRAVELPRFGIRARLPAGWILLRGPATGPETVLSFLPEADARRAGAPPRVHAHHDVSFVSILPAGFGTELPASQSRSLSSWLGTLELPPGGIEESPRPPPRGWRPVGVFPPARGAPRGPQRPGDDAVFRAGPAAASQAPGARPIFGAPRSGSFRLSPQAGRGQRGS